MPEVFISYHEESAGELAEQIADALDAAGISAWCARRDMALGGNFAREIPNQIHACRLFLLILNDSAYHSEHIENEVGIAFSRVNKGENLLILPLELGDFTRKDWVEYYLIHTQSMKFPAHPDEKRLQRLVKYVAKALNRERQPAPPEVKPTLSLKIDKRGKFGDNVTFAPGKCGDNVNYTLDKNGVLTIFGTGSMWHFIWDPKTNVRDTPWWSERETITHVEIQDGVTEIGWGSFESCAEMTSVSIPDSVAKIGPWAFYGCAGLTSVSISDNVTEIGRNAFRGCTGLTSLTIPDNVTEIGRNAFRGCTGLTSVTIPGNMKEIGEGLFANCAGLTSVTISDRVMRIANGAFLGCVGLTSVTIPDSVARIEVYAFYGCDKLKSVNVPTNVNIDPDAFLDTVRITRR